MLRQSPVSIFIIFCSLFLGLHAAAQLPVCDLVYYKVYRDTSNKIWNYNPSVPVSATNPVMNTIISPPSGSYGGLAVSPVLGSGSSRLTFYCTNVLSTAIALYVYYDPITKAWVNTGHRAGAPNIGAGGGYIYGLDGLAGKVYRYDGTGDAILIASLLPGEGGLYIYDLVVDCEGNWYVFFETSTQKLLKKYNPYGVLLQTWVIYSPPGLSLYPAGGIAIIGNTLYTDNGTGGGINSYSLGKDTLTVIDLSGAGLIPQPEDMASCAGNLSTGFELNIKASVTKLYCLSSPVTFTASSLTVGIGYKWKVNGIPVGSSLPTYTYSPANGDRVTCTMTIAGTAPCDGPAFVTSNTITITIDGSTFLSQPKVISPVNYCRWASGPALSAVKAAADDTLVWYSTPAGGAGKPSLVPPTGTPGTFTYYVSERKGLCESARVPLQVIIDDLSVFDFTFGHPSYCGARDGWIKFRTNRIHETCQVNYDKDGLPEPVLTLISDAAGYITIPGLGKGSYTAIYITDSKGCSSLPYYGPIVLKGPGAIPPLAANNGPLCLGAIAQLSTIPAAGTTYLWKGPDGFSAAMSNPSFIADLSSAGVYTLVSTKGDCVSDPVTTTLVVNELPRKYDLPDQKVCEGNDLFVEQPQEVSTAYEWSQLSGTFILSSAQLSRKQLRPEDAGLYILHAENDNGCTMRDTINVSVQPQTTLSHSADTIICAKDSITLYAGSNTSRVLWSPSGTDTKAYGARPDMTTTYTVTAIADEAICPDISGTVTITVMPLPQVQGFDTVVHAGIAYPLLPMHSNDIVRWKWTPADGLSCNDCPAPVFNAKQSLSYIVSVSSQEGCTAAAEVSVRVLCDGANITMPNGFTPNGDAKNDVFYVRGTGFTVRSFRIYNRNGEMVFSRSDFPPNDPQYAWDGSFNGQPISDAGGFVYYIEATCKSDGSPVTAKGTVLLVR